MIDYSNEAKAAAAKAERIYKVASNQPQGRCHCGDARRVSNANLHEIPEQLA
jgi:hypothetical protein